MRDEFNKFMQGRYGVDEFSRFTMGVALALIILTMFVNIVNRSVGGVLDFLGIAAIVYAYLRILSRNIQQRYAENQKYVQFIAPITKKVDFFKRKRKDKTHKYYKCPTCNQVVRVPKGRGKIEISCPKCHTKFIKRT